MKSYSVGNMNAETGSPLTTYGEKRKGKCGHYLSRYNPKDDLCRPCARAAREAALLDEPKEAKDDPRPNIRNEVLNELPGTAAEIGRRLGLTTKRASDVLRREWKAGRIVRSGSPGMGKGPGSKGFVLGGYRYAYPEEDS